MRTCRAKHRGRTPARGGEAGCADPPPAAVVRPLAWFCARGAPKRARKRCTPEEIVAEFRQVEVLTSQGMPVADAIRQIGVSAVPCCRRRQEYGGLTSDQVTRPKEQVIENARLRTAISGLTRVKLILRDACRGNARAPRAAAPASSLRDIRSTCPGAVPAGRADSTARHGARCQAAARPPASGRGHPEGG